MKRYITLFSVLLLLLAVFSLPVFAGLFGSDNYYIIKKTGDGNSVVFGCPLGQALRDFNSGSGLFTCIAVGGSGTDTNIFTAGIMRSDNNAFNIDVNAFDYNIYGRNVYTNATLSADITPTFASANWTATNGWSADGAGTQLTKVTNVAVGTITPSGAGATPVIGTTYRITIVCSAKGSPAVTYTYGGVSGTAITATTITDYITAISTGKLIISGAVSSTATITSIKIEPLINGTGDVNVEGTLNIVSHIKPYTDAITALAFTKKDGVTPVMTLDTLNTRVLVGDPDLGGTKYGALATLDVRGWLQVRFTDSAAFGVSPQVLLIQHQGGDNFALRDGLSSYTQFSPNFISNIFSHSNRALAFTAKASSALDTGTLPVLSFQAELLQPGSAVAVRPLFSWENYGNDIKMIMSASGNLGLAYLTPSEKLVVGGNAWITDSNFLYFGASKNASIKYSGTDLNINPKSVGTGKVNVNGDLKVDNNYYSSDGTVGFTGTCTILGLTSIVVKNGIITGCA